MDKLVQYKSFITRGNPYNDLYILYFFAASDRIEGQLYQMGTYMKTYGQGQFFFVNTTKTYIVINAKM